MPELRKFVSELLKKNYTQIEKRHMSAISSAKTAEQLSAAIDALREDIEKNGDSNSQLLVTSLMVFTPAVLNSSRPKARSKEDRVMLPSSIFPYLDKAPKFIGNAVASWLLSNTIYTQDVPSYGRPQLVPRERSVPVLVNIVGIPENEFNTLSLDQQVSRAGTLHGLFEIIQKTQHVIQNSDGSELPKDYLISAIREVESDYIRNKGSLQKLNRITRNHGLRKKVQDILSEYAIRL